MEWRLRGLARSVLILTPPALVEQWQGELRRKSRCTRPLTTHRSSALLAARHGPPSTRLCLDAHRQTRAASFGPPRAQIGLVIFDEAHHLRDRTTQLWRFARELQKKYILLPTATPVQNNLEELFNLVTLREPGLLIGCRSNGSTKAAVANRRNA